MTNPEGEQIIESPLDSAEQGAQPEVPLRAWVREFNQQNEAALTALGIQVSGHVLTSDEFAAIKAALIEERRGRAITDRGTTVKGQFAIAYGQMARAGWAWREGDTIYSVTTPTPYFFERSPGAESLHERLQEIGQSHIYVRAALEALYNDTIATSDDNTIKQGTLGPALPFAGRAAKYKDVIAAQPHVLGGVSPYMRFDVVMTMDGGTYVVDIAPKSGAWGFWIRRGELLAEQGIDGMFSAEPLDEGITHLKARAGLRREDVVLILGGDYGSPTQADMAAIDPSNPVMRLSILADGYLPKDGEVFLHNADLSVNSEGQLQVNTVSGPIVVKGVGFWHGYEHLGGHDTNSPGAIGYARVKKIMELAATGDVRLLNHPVPMQILESKVLMALLQKDTDLQRSVVTYIMEHEGLTESDAEQMLQLVLDTTPRSTVIRTDRERGHGVVIVSSLNSDLSWTETDQSLSQFDSNARLIAKPVSAYGAQGIVQGTASSILSQLEPGIPYEIGLVVDTLHLSGLMDPHTYDADNIVTLAQPHGLRTEVFISPVDNGKARIAGIAHTFLPGKDTGTRDVRIHGGLSMVSIEGPAQ